MTRPCGSKTTIVILAGLSWGFGTTAGAQSPDFERQILPLLYNRCFSCHSEKASKLKGDLRLDTAKEVRASGVIVPGKPNESELLSRVSLPLTDDGHMPPIKGGSQPLNDAERDLLRRWIADGAKTGDWLAFPHRETAIPYEVAPIKRSDVPHLTRRVDELVEAYHRSKGSRLNPIVGDEVFVRRLYLDVAGRIPTLAESTQFLKSTAVDKRAKLIDTLLQSEAYVSHTFNWKADLLRLISKGIPGQPAWIYEEWVKESIRSGMAYDKFVRNLITAKGYLWENGAVGFYLRDLGMPLDHMSNLSRVFLGTRIECAQCHDHPYEPVTQRDFYQLTAFTYGVSNLYSSAGYSTDNVKHWNELVALMKTSNANEELRQSVSGTVAPLKRLTTDTDHLLKYPESYANDASARGTPVAFRTPFGDEPTATAANRREVFADWLTSPRNPRFAKNIANRLWKRVMGLGLIEPVDSLSPVNRPEYAELLDYLTESIARLGFDERAYLAVILNSRVYQAEAVRTPPEPGVPFTFQGPLLRRLSAEQIWDSLLTLLVEGLDDRKPLSDAQDAWTRDKLVQLTKMNAAELLDLSKKMAAYRVKLRQHSIEVADLKVALKQVQEKGDVDAARRIQKEDAKSDADFEKVRKAYQMSPPTNRKETDPRWTRVTPLWVRASEIRTPIPLGHFLRQFGQSDRREIDASNKNPNLTHSLTLMNGDLTRSILEDKSFARSRLSPLTDKTERVKAAYQSILSRSPTADEMTRCRELLTTSPTPEADILWALLNSPEFLFIP